jgi:hypothetical protein
MPWFRASIVGPLESKQSAAPPALMHEPTLARRSGASIDYDEPKRERHSDEFNSALWCANDLLRTVYACMALWERSRNKTFDPAGNV